MIVKKQLFLFIIFGFSISLFSQNKKRTLAKSVNSILQTKPNTYKEIDKILKPFQRDSVKVKTIIDQFLVANYKNGLAYEYIKLGNVYRKYSKYDKAIETHKKALEVAANKEFQIFSLNMLGVDYRRKNIYTSAIDYNKKALEIAEKIEQPNSGVLRSMEVSYNSIGNIYILLEQYSLAENSFKKAIENAEKSGNKWSLSINNENIAKVKEAQDSLNLAIFYTQKALAIDKSINNHYGRMICYNRLGKLHIKKGEYSKAKTFLKEAVPIAKSVKNQYYIALINNNLGWVATKTNNYAKAKEHFKISLEIAEKRNYKTALTEIYTNYSEYNQLTKNYKEALKYYKKYTSISNELLNDKTSKYVNDIIIKYDSERKTNQLKNLAKQNEIAQLQLIKNRNFWIIAFITLLLFLAILYFLYRQRLFENEKRILTLEQDVLRTQMNPHFIFNALNSIKHYIINNEQKNAVYYLNKFSKLIRKILESSALKEVTLQEELETMDLYMNIENIRFSNEISYNIQVDKSLDLSKIKVPPLVLQPFLENALWHGLSSKKGAKKISLSVKKLSHDFIQIDIEDNGIGRKASAKIKSNKVIQRKSIGIEITIERLNNFIKDFKNPFSIFFNDLVDRDKNSLGTKVILKIPTQ
ncbi:tetratricopeptide repeat-containing sensor histidine kinase [Polaribacter cellanae]|uniref:Tetratricopeptide repeat protein n=1 Tax=Polaribacter cellanae TaxID=2818493 RepID=A0A975CL05_9FLAO|nr:tetratricopeptide repeat protein [Polaribacter cellanae]QTE21608.1 tetratricopeptide repeat protein [Polaribacter cellanae]